MQTAALASRRSDATGFTLIEVLVVLVIIGIALTFATLSLNPTGPSERLQTTAQRLLALTQAAANEAILSGKTMGLETTRTGYRFVRFDDTGWHPITDEASSLRPRRLGPGITLARLDAGGGSDGNRQSERQAATLLPPPSPLPPTAAQLKQQASARAASKDQGQVALPAALFLSSGELLPFKLELSAKGVDHRFDITGDANGDIAMKRVDR